jgi:hypothetical protein
MLLPQIWTVTRPWAAAAPPAKAGMVMALAGVGRAWWLILWLQGAITVTYVTSVLKSA